MTSYFKQFETALLQENFELAEEHIKTFVCHDYFETNIGEKNTFNNFLLNQILPTDNTKLLKLYIDTNLIEYCNQKQAFFTKKSWNCIHLILSENPSFFSNINIPNPETIPAYIFNTLPKDAKIPPHTFYTLLKNKSIYHKARSILKYQLSKNKASKYNVESYLCAPLTPSTSNSFEYDRYITFLNIFSDYPPYLTFYFKSLLEQLHKPSLYANLTQLSKLLRKVLILDNSVEIRYFLSVLHGLFSYNPKAQKFFKSLKISPFNFCIPTFSSLTSKTSEPITNFFQDDISSFMEHNKEKILINIPIDADIQTIIIQYMLLNWEVEIPQSFANDHINTPTEYTKIITKYYANNLHLLSTNNPNKNNIILSILRGDLPLNTKLEALNLLETYDEIILFQILRNSIEILPHFIKMFNVTSEQLYSIYKKIIISDVNAELLHRIIPYIKKTIPLHFDPTFLHTNNYLLILHNLHSHNIDLHSSDLILYKYCILYNLTNQYNELTKLQPLTPTQNEQIKHYKSCLGLP